MEVIQALIFLLKAGPSCKLNQVTLDHVQLCFKNLRMEIPVSWATCSVLNQFTSELFFHITNQNFPYCDLCPVIPHGPIKKSLAPFSVSLFRQGKMPIVPQAAWSHFHGLGVPQSPPSLCGGLCCPGWVVDLCLLTGVPSLDTLFQNQRSLTCARQRGAVVSCVSFVTLQGLPAASRSPGTQNSSAELLPSLSISCCSCSSKIPSQSLLSTLASHWNQHCGCRSAFWKSLLGKGIPCNWGQIFIEHVEPLVVEQQNQSLSCACWLCSFPAQPVDLGSGGMVCAKKTCKHRDSCFTFNSLINQNHL